MGPNRRSHTISKISINLFLNDSQIDGCIYTYFFVITGAAKKKSGRKYNKEISPFCAAVDIFALIERNGVGKFV